MLQRPFVQFALRQVLNGLHPPCGYFSLKDWSGLAAVFDNHGRADKWEQRNLILKPGFGRIRAVGCLGGLGSSIPAGNVKSLLVILARLPLGVHPSFREGGRRPGWPRGGPPSA